MGAKQRGQAKAPPVEIDEAAIKNMRIIEARLKIAVKNKDFIENQAVLAVRLVLFKLLSLGTEGFLLSLKAMCEKKAVITMFPGVVDLAGEAITGCIQPPWQIIAGILIALPEAGRLKLKRGEEIKGDSWKKAIEGRHDEAQVIIDWMNGVSTAMNEKCLTYEESEGEEDGGKGHEEGNDQTKDQGKEAPSETGKGKTDPNARKNGNDEEREETGTGTGEGDLNNSKNVNNKDKPGTKNGEKNTGGTQEKKNANAKGNKKATESTGEKKNGNDANGKKKGGEEGTSKEANKKSNEKRKRERAKKEKEKKEKEKNKKEPKDEVTDSEEELTEDSFGLALSSEEDASMEGESTFEETDVNMEDSEGEREKERKEKKRKEREAQRKKEKKREKKRKAKAKREAREQTEESDEISDSESDKSRSPKRRKKILEIILEAKVKVKKSSGLRKEIKLQLIWDQTMLYIHHPVSMRFEKAVKLLLENGKGDIIEVYKNLAPLIPAAKQERYAWPLQRV